MSLSLSTVESLLKSDGRLKLIYSESKEVSFEGPSDRQIAVNRKHTKTGIRVWLENVFDPDTLGLSRDTKCELYPATKPRDHLSAKKLKGPTNRDPKGHDAWKIIFTLQSDFEKVLAAYFPSTMSASNLRKHQSGGQKGGWTIQLDKDLITQIEQAAISATWAYFENEGYSVESVETDNRGWDLEATKNNECLFLEVKGHIGNAVNFELTPNEYEKLKANPSEYRVCLVRNAIQQQNVEVYKPMQVKGEWRLTRLNGTSSIQLSERTAARASEVQGNP